MEMTQTVGVESNKRKRETVSPATGSDDDDDKLRVTCGGEKSSFSSEIVAEESIYDKEHGHRDSIERVSPDTDGLVNPDLRKKCDPISGKLYVATRLAQKVVTYYNNEAKNNEDRMELIRIKESFIHCIEGRELFFTYFVARLTAKDGETKETNCRSVMCQNQSRRLEVYSIKLGSLEEEKLKKRIQECPGRRVLISESRELESKEKLLQEKTQLSSSKQPPLDVNMEGTDSESQGEDSDTDSQEDCETEVDTDDEEEDHDSEADSDNEEVEGYDLVKEEIDSTVEEFAREAVLDHNKKAGYEEMQLIEIKEALYMDMPEEVFHINFDARLMDKDGEETGQTICQAVVYQDLINSGPVKVFSLKVGSPKGNDSDDWCREPHCVCGYLCQVEEKLTDKEWLKSKCLDWYSSSGDEVEDKKMKYEPPQQPAPAFMGGKSDLENQCASRTEKICES